MTISVSLNPKLLRPGLRQVWGMRMAQWNPQYINLFDEGASTYGYEEYQEIAPFGIVPEQRAGVNVSYDDLLNGYTTRLVNVSYGLGYKITREMIDDNQYRQMMALPKALANSVILTVENTAANVYNNAFATLGADGKALCATDHPLPGGGTLANKPTVDADLSATSLEQMFIDVKAFTDGRGNKIHVIPQQLLVHPTDMYVASELIKSQYSPETANNAINPVFMNQLLPKGFKENIYFTDTNAWFVRTDQEGLVMQRRVWPAEFRDDNDFSTLDIKQACYFRLAFGFYNPRALYGSSGV